MLLTFSCYFIYNGTRDTVAEKEFDMAIQMTLERVLAQVFKKKEMGKKKVTFKQRHVNVTKHVISCGRMIYLALVYFDMKQTLRVFISNV